MLFLSEFDVRALLPMPKAIALMREVFEALRKGEARNQPRRRLAAPTGAVLHSMAGAWGPYFGTKFYSTHPKHGAWFLFVLYDSETARPLALFEANWLGQIRTGACSGYATDLLARPDASVVGMIGSGFQARSQLEAMLEVRPVREVRVWSRSAERREAFAEEYRRRVNIRATAGAEEAIRGASIIITATYAKDPVIEADWVDPQAHVNAMGTNNAQRRELPGELLERASVITVDCVEQARIEAGDLLLGLKDWSRVVELADQRDKPRPSGITVFKSLGLGVEDVRAGAWVYEEALRKGAGTNLPVLYS